MALLLYLLGGVATALAQSSDTTSASGTAATGTSPTAPVSQLPAVEVLGEHEQSDTGSSDRYVPISTITATKTDTPLIETPQSVSVVTRQQMTDQNVQSVTEALRYTASVLSEVRGASAAGAPYLMSRGFYLEQFLDGSRLPSNVNFGYAIPSFDPYGLERIDVLHGPSSVLYGQASPGGVVNMVSKQPTTTPVHDMFITTGNHNRAEAGFDLGGALTSDGTLSYRLTGSADQNDTQVDGVKQKHVYIAPSITWKPTENDTLTILAKYQRDPDVGYYNFVPAYGSLFDTPNGKISSHTNLGDANFDSHSKTQASIGYTYEHRFDPTWTFRQNLRYTYVSDDFSNVFANGFAPGSSTTLNRYAFFNDESARFFTLDNQVQAKFSTGDISHTALFGADYQRVLYQERVGLGLAPSLNPFDPVYASVAMPATTSDDFIRMKQIGLYAQDQLAWNKWRFLIGGREDFASADDNNPVTSSYTSQSQKAFTWRTGLVYLFDNGIAPYASYSTSFNPQAGVLADGSVTKPTTAQQYEVGVKYQPPGLNSYITAAAFDLHERNVLTADLLNPGYSDQAGKVRARGVELEAHANLSRDLNLTASYAYLSSVTTESNDTGTALDGSSVSLQGKQTWGTPRNILAAWLDYTRHGGPLNGLGFGAGVRYLGASYDTTNTIRVPSATFIDAAVHYEVDRHWLLSLNASNLLNRKYVASCYSAATCTYGSGVEVLASARYRW
ncbi:MAG TPA: TonB-dependent siderophore receptor [Bordetella sp.]